MLAARGVRLRANTYFWGSCVAIGVFALLAIGRLSADDTKPGNSNGAGASNSARLENEIQRLHDELASTKELLRQATDDGELRLAQRGGPAHADAPPAGTPDKSSATTPDGKKLDTDAWRSLDKELARKWRRGPGGPGEHPGMRGFRGGPPMWGQDGFRGGPPWMHHRGYGRGGPRWAHHRHHRGWRHWARHHHHRWAHRHHHGHGDGWSRGASGRFGRGPGGNDGMMRITQRLNMLERKIDALMHEVRGTHDGPERGRPMRDGPPHDGPLRDGPPRDGGPRDAAPARKPGE